MSSQRETAYEKLHQLIASGELAPGERVMELEIARQFGLSRTPVREAIRKMEAEGIISHSPHIGAVVRKLSHQEIVELYEMRLVLEEAAAAMAAKHASEAEIALMRVLNEQILESENSAEAAQINAKFHALIFEAARNQFLIRSFHELSRLIIILGATTIDDEKRREEVYAQHNQIVDAIEAGSEGDAKIFIRNHFITSLGQRLRGGL